jgi:hypothetical protein
MASGVPEEDPGIPIADFIPRCRFSEYGQQPDSGTKGAADMDRKRLERYLATLFAGAIALAPLPLRIAHAEATPETALWAEVNARNITVAPDSDLGVRSAGKVFRADPDALARTLSRAPMELPGSAKRAGLVFSIPMPDGALQRFEVLESPVMAPELARKYPDLRTYVGQGIDDPTATARLDRTSNGFHAMVLSARGETFVDPYARGDVRHYVSYYAHEARRRFACLVPKPAADATTSKGASLAPPLGGMLRTYRLAMAATGEFTQFHGGTVRKGLDAVVSTVNRVTGIYERDMAIRFVLVAGEDRIIYADPNTDPYSNDSPDALLDENQTNLDQVIGTAEYDIGHVVGTGGGGLAAPGVCVPQDKAKGETGSESPFGDAFDVSYVAHEIGHQFGAEHTFNNGEDGSCGGNRARGTAYEPGSGTTIMGYAGICQSADVQRDSDSYFHVASLGEMSRWVTENPCAPESPTGNTPPTVDAGAPHTIPAGTPFALTAQGSDVDGDALTYSWEQFDLGPESPPEGDDGLRPIFRSFSPTESPTRTFPQMSALLAGGDTPWEILPSTNRTLTFRVTARDNRARGGGVAFAETTLRVTRSAGPFAVAGPNAGEVWTGGSRRTITWDVAATDRAPVGAVNVRISISTDGGQTFPVVVSPSTPNDGSETITVPNAPTDRARIKVEAVGNIFFHVSRADFKIEEGTGGGGTVPTIADVIPLEVAGKPFRIKIVGESFLDGLQIFVGESAEPWPLVKHKSESVVVLKKGPTLEQAFPVGVSRKIRVVNADGGEASTTFTR